jgi:uncharacterized protein YoxC
MKYINKSSIGSVLPIIMLLIFGLKACGLGEQTDEANKLKDEANVILDKENDLTDKSNELFDDLLGDNLTKVKDFKAYKEKNKSKFDELISLNGQIERLAAESTDKYEQILKLKLPEKYKEYMDIKIQEFKKRADGHKLVAPFIKEFLQTNDVDKLIKVMEDFNRQTADIAKEAAKLSEKAGQIAKDNPKVIKN